MKTLLLLVACSILFSTATSLAETDGEANTVSNVKMELSQIKQKLSSLERKINTQSTVKAEEQKKITKKYENDLSRAKADYETVINKISKRAKDAGVDGVSALFADKKKKAIIESINKEKAKVKAEYKRTKANAEADYKSAKARLEDKAKAESRENKDAKTKLEKDYKQKVADLKLAVKAENAATEAKAKAEVAAKKRVDAEAKAKMKADAIAKKKAETDKENKKKAERARAIAEAKADLAAAAAKKKSDLANAEKKAIRQAEVRSGEKKTINTAYTAAIVKADSNFKAVNMRLEKKAKSAGVSGFGSLFADKKKTAILKSINEEKKRAGSEYETAKANANAEQNRRIAEWELQIKSDQNKLAQEKKSIAKDYDSKKAEVELRLNADKIAAKAKIQEERKAKAQALAQSKAEEAAQNKAKRQQDKEMKVAREKAKAGQQAAIAQAKEEKKQRLTDLAAKAEDDSNTLKDKIAVIEKEYKEAKAKANLRYKGKAAAKKSKDELARAKNAMKSALAAIDKESERQAKIRAGDKKKIETDYRNALAKAKSDYNVANKRVEKRAKDAGIEGFGALLLDKKKAGILKSTNKDKARIKAEYKSAKANASAGRKQSMAALDSEAKSQTKEAANKRTKIVSRFNVVKVTVRVKPAGKTEYKQALAKVEAAYKETKSGIQEKKKLLAEKNAKEKNRIETDYDGAVLKANLKFEFENTKARYADVNFEDESALFTVKEIRISGNNLISTATLLEGIRPVYETSDNNGDPDNKKMYDFRVLHEIIHDPGQPRKISQNTIQGFTRYILSKYKEEQYAGIYVYVSKNAVIKETAELRDGILPIEVLEGKVANVTANRFDIDRQETEKEVLKSSVLASWSPAKEGKTIKKKELDDFVRLLNLNPDRYISAVISRGDKPDTLNLGYDVYEASPWHYYVQLDNSGTDKRQWNPRIGVTNTNLTGRDDRFSVMYQAPPDDVEGNYSVFGNYEFPFLSPRLRLGVYGGYSQFEITPESGAGINFRGNGSFYGGTLRYNLMQMNEWFFDFTGSLSHEVSKVTPSLGIEADVEMDLFGLGGEIHRSSDMSTTFLSFNRIESMSGSSKEDFAKARLDTDPDFTIDVFSAKHTQFLDKSKIHELSGSFRSMNSNKRLIPAKMSTFGGLYSVRGYSENDIVADGGILASLQYRFDLAEYSMGSLSDDEKKERRKKRWAPQISFVGFVDHGRAKIKNPVPGEIEAQELFGVGLGTEVELGKNIFGAVYYSVPMRGTKDTEKGDGRWNFNFIYRF